MCGDSYDQFVEETSKLSGGDSDGGGGGSIVVIEVGSLKRNMVVGQCLLLNGVVVFSLCVW